VLQDRGLADAPLAEEDDDVTMRPAQHAHHLAQHVRPPDESGAIADGVAGDVGVEG